KTKEAGSRIDSGGFAGEAVLVGDGQPPLRGFAEVRSDFAKGFALGMTAGESRDGGGITAGVGLGPDDRGQDNGDIDDKGRGWSSGTAHGRVPPFLVDYNTAVTRARPAWRGRSLR